MRTTPSRRRLLGGLASLLGGGALAGCGDQVDGTDGAPEESSPTSSLPGTTEPDRSGTTTTATPTLDLREANVVAVAFERADGQVEFRVTLHHDDAGEEGYANWWQVERLDGTQLGRRELLHPHDQQPFTRSATITVPAGVTCVVVRGHDETHGYGGRAMTVNLDTGSTRAIDQGVDPRPFEVGDCP